MFVYVGLYVDREGGGGGMCTVEYDDELWISFDIGIV